MYPVPQELLSRPPYPDFLRHLAEHGYYGEGDADALVAQRVEACGTRPARALRTMRPTGGGTASSAVGWRAAARSR